MMNAHFHLQNWNWNIAIIEVETAFEVFINSKIRDYYLKNNFSESKVENIMMCGLKNLIEHHLPKVTGKLFSKGQADYDNWSLNTNEMRNQVVHNGYESTEQEAKKAILGVENALTYLFNREKKKFWTNTKPPTLVNEFFGSND